MQTPLCCVITQCAFACSGAVNETLTTARRFSRGYAAVEPVLGPLAPCGVGRKGRREDRELRRKHELPLDEGRGRLDLPLLPPSVSLRVPPRAGDLPCTYLRAIHTPFLSIGSGSGDPRLRF